MNTQKNYGRLDRFRLIAAFLVIAIHTSPLTSFSADADFFFTRVLARAAVPFFFMVTGHFTLSALFTSDNTGHSCPPHLQRAAAGRAVKRCLIKLCLLYGAAILLYLPLGIYAGHYRGLSITEVMRMLIFDGTFYHLWYFPACILG
ncbi:MAG: acyltransferase family protein, partial [Acetatifactor sp.]|nr:acyltransferase family protein [Acetatifactor sp.]